MKKKNIAIILSGGVGKRFKENIPKQLYKLNNKTIIEITLEKFVQTGFFEKIIIVSNKKIINETKKISGEKRLQIIAGGKTRQESVLKGLKEAKHCNPNNVIIHDVVRPFFSKKLLDKILKKLSTKDCVIPIQKVSDSVRYFKNNSYIDVNRENLNLIQTPQGFNFLKIFNAYKKLKKNHTDDSIIAYNNGIKISVIDGERMNFKITDKNDYELAKQLWKENKYMDIVKIGHGFDVHALKPEKDLIILGIKIPFSKGLEGHSDADVGFHALVDAILGALGMGDIGEHFPPSDIKWKNKPSKYFLEYTKDLLLKKNYKINNIDITLICEKPKLTKYKKNMKKSIAKILNIHSEKINVKATTTEKLGFLGREEGIACQSSVCITKND